MLRGNRRYVLSLMEMIAIWITLISLVALGQLMWSKVRFIEGRIYSYNETEFGIMKEKVAWLEETILNKEE